MLFDLRGTRQKERFSCRGNEGKGDPETVDDQGQDGVSGSIRRPVRHADGPRGRLVLRRRARDPAEKVEARTRETEQTHRSRRMGDARTHGQRLL